MSRCTGACCKRFPLTATYAEVQAAAEVVKAGGRDRYQDTVFIADMLIPLKPAPDGKEFFTCRHHDAASGNCTVYEQRPTLCREHPFYGVVNGHCSTAGCELDHDAMRREMLPDYDAKREEMSKQMIELQAELNEVKAREKYAHLPVVQ